MAVTEVIPPSTVKVAPVMNDASSESRKRMGLAISSGDGDPLEGGPLLELLGGIRAARRRGRAWGCPPHPGTPR